MSGQLMPAPGEAARLLQGTDPLAPRLPRAVARAVDRESARGLVGAARAQAAGFVAAARIQATEYAIESALGSLERLHAYEEAIAKQDPIKADRVAGFVQTFCAVSQGYIRRLPQEC